MIPKKGRRIVRVDGAEYAWTIRKKPTYLEAIGASMALAVQAHSDEPGSVLVVDLKIPRPDNWLRPHQTAVKPAMVREMIAGALASGWRPLVAGKPFFYEYPLIMDRS